MDYASRLDCITFLDEGETRTGQVMAGPFTVPRDQTYYYYVVEPDGEELLVNHDNLVREPA